ncbi:bifunctional riboflavin kinase/FAD synthetase [Cryptosporangium phraense]|uniref:Riboflavin biosynthesis protein n=1 Tax=Cryptosporangium phraense TaxID=2593070 RepID=A0A545AW21_9ACTN|nr:bifunctional riboflavin kinase/FAD synthetase [Cryptosporangium phraense]TQS44805.1 bifunctional riboflavin kinase/FAD synthetase [Cryptosporangium phraense]
MLRWRGLAESAPDWNRTVVTIGVFDGVHRGHRALIEATVHEAAALLPVPRPAGGEPAEAPPVVVVTFDPHPEAVLHPGKAPDRLTTLDHRAVLIEGLAADGLVVDGLCTLPFTEELAALAPADFVRTVLVEHLRAAAVVVGEGFRFGYRAAGDVDLLRSLGAEFGFTVRAVPLLTDAEGVVSSTRIRADVETGDVDRAAAALGRPHRVEGVVVRGDQRGRELGFPTANLSSPAFTSVPADGVYAGWLIRDPARRAGDRETPLPAAISIGTNPTFAGERARRVEAYILDFDEDIYDEAVAVDFAANLRPTIAFSSVDALITQMNADVSRVRELLLGA